MVEELVGFFGDLNLQKVRITRPAKFIFLCGGPISLTTISKAKSVRDYLYRLRDLPNKLKTNLVLAERATQLYRDTGYEDLISFEEDIARIASIVLIIAESPGSLAELGAFSSIDVTREALRIIINQAHADDESFIRYGPIERIRKKDEGLVGFYPWSARKNGDLILSTVSPHYAEMLKFVKGHLNSLSDSEAYPENPDVQLFYVIHWVIYLSLAASIRTITALIQTLMPSVEKKVIRNKMYCMQLAGWIASEEYSGKRYFFTCNDIDPFSYAFNEGVVERDSIRRKLAATSALRRLEAAPKHIRQVAVSRRGSS